MNVSTRGLIEIMSHEGICLEPYLDSVGVWTIGVGQTKSDDIDPKTMGKITLQQAVDLFKRKIKQYTNAVDALHLDLKQHQYDALTSLCYNFGPGNLRKLCKDRSLNEIGEAIMLYTKPPEITERRLKEQQLFKTGQYSNTDGKILVFPVVNNHPRYRDGYKIDARPYFGMSTTAKAASAAAGGAVVGGAAAAAASAGWSWIEIGLTGFIAAGIVTAIVLLIKKVRS
jgi:lysozyme